MSEFSLFRLWTIAMDAKGFGCWQHAIMAWTSMDAVLDRWRDENLGNNRSA